MGRDSNNKEQKMTSYSNVSVVQLTTIEKRADALKVRIAVFVDEQKYSLEDELDRYTNIFKIIQQNVYITQL